MKQRKRSRRIGDSLFDAFWFARLEKTTQLSPIDDRKVLALIDEQNLSITAKNHDLRLRYDLLAERIRSQSSSAKLHIFIAAKANDGRFRKYLARIGYIVHVKTVRRKYSSDGGPNWDHNVDNLLAFWAGLFAHRNRYGVIILASGDYGLSGELSEAISRMRPRGSLEIMSLSLSGSTSSGLIAQWNPYIAANLKIGLDLLGPLNPSVRWHTGRNGNGQQNRFC